MKVGFIAPQSIAAVNGGVRTQALMTAKHLKELGIEVYFVSPWEDISKVELDIFHVFTASAENHGIISRLKEQEKKIVLSPVMYSNRNSSTIRNFLNVEEKLPLSSYGIRSEFTIKKELCLLADLLLPNTTSEASMIEEAFKIPRARLKVVPNGVEKRFSEANPDIFIEKMGFNDFILTVGQVSAERKNILKLLEAHFGIDTKLVIIGNFSNSEYSNKCRALADNNPNIHLMNSLEHHSDLLSSAYAASKVFVLPSQFETPGISALEAGLAGANVVITEVGGTKDYFENFVEYISPSSISSIKNGITKALNSSRSKDLKNHILSKFTWDKVAEQTLKEYKEVLT
jgi:glycosyltransferase involved in cell wall biosynthesis